MNNFWKAVKSLEGKTVSKVLEDEVSGGICIKCTDGTSVSVSVDAEELDLQAVVNEE